MTYQGSTVPKVADPAWELRMPYYGRRQQNMRQEKSLKHTQGVATNEFSIGLGKIDQRVGVPKTETVLGTFLDLRIRPSG